MPLATAKKHERLTQRARIIQSIRAFFMDAGFLEVETPQRIPLNAPEAQITPLSSGDWQLQTSPELAMKRLLASGYGKIFQISHCWREAERGRRHLPEFTMLEWYRTDCDYNELMNDCTQLLRALVPHGTLTYQGDTIGFGQPFESLSVDAAFARHTATTPAKALQDDNFDELLAFSIEPQLGRLRPTFLYDYPAQLASLARRKPGHPALAERFELYVAGLELANGFSELTDPAEQRRRFESDARTIANRYGRSARLPEPFLAALPQMPPSAGIALGIDRLVMLLTDASEIDQVVAFTPEEL